jgi:hypothetical protein
VTAEVLKLASYVAGLDGGADVGVMAQQWCGRLFFSDYVATAESYRAGDLLARWPTLDPVRGLLYKTSGRLARAKHVLEHAAKHDVYCVHSTSIGMRNLVGSLRSLRELAKQPRRAELNVGQRAVLLSLVAPAAVVRGCLDEVSAPFLDRPLTAGTLIVFPLSRMFERSRAADIAFMTTSWNACPARAAVLGMLNSVWDLATGARHATHKLNHAAHNSNGAPY